MRKIIKNIMCSKWTKRVIYALTIFATIAVWYIALFVGHGNTHIDDICFAVSVILIALQVVRSFIKFTILEKERDSEKYSEISVDKFTEKN